MPTYTVTCAIDGPGGLSLDGAVRRLQETTTAMRAEGIDIDQRAVLIASEPDCAVAEMLVRFEAPTEGVVGWHIYRSELPAGGIRRSGQSTQG